MLKAAVTLAPHPPIPSTPPNPYFLFVTGVHFPTEIIKMVLMTFRPAILKPAAFQFISFYSCFFCFNHALSLHNVSKFCFALQFVLWMMCVELLRFTLDGFLITHNDNDAVWTSFFLSFFCGNLVLVS